MATSDRPESYLSQPYSRVLIPDPSGGYFAEVLELPGCFTQGETPDEAIANLEDAMAGWIATALEEGQAIPPPQASQGYSGHVALRLPKSLHREAVRRAQMEGISLNQYLVTAVAARIGAEDFVDRLAERVASRLAQTITIVDRTSVHEVITSVTSPQPERILSDRRQIEEADTSKYTQELSALVESSRTEEHQNA